MYKGDYIVKWYKKMSPCGSVVEHTLGKGEAAGSIPAMGFQWIKK